MRENNYKNSKIGEEDRKNRRGTNRRKGRLSTSYIRCDDV